MFNLKSTVCIIWRWFGEDEM